jgi:hypothetical protein
MPRYGKKITQVNCRTVSSSFIVVDDAHVRILSICECGRQLRAHDLSIDYDGDADARALVVTGVCSGCHNEFLTIEFDE